MLTLKKPLALTLFAILIFCDVSLAKTEKKAENQKSSYIVHVSKHQMPVTFTHHSFWYKSILNSVSNSAEMLYTYDTAIHGFSTTLTPEEALLLKNKPGILKVLPDQIYKIHTTRTPKFLGLDKLVGKYPSVSKSNDVIVGLLDTGIWPESKSYDDKGYGPIPSTWKGKCETGANFTTANCNKKLIGARFYGRGFVANMGPLDRNDDSVSPRDDDGHGTHTSSTAAGSPVANASLFGYASGTARGMAMGARIAMYKVCWQGGLCVVSDILAALDQSIIDNVNVLSISLGGFPMSYYKDSLAIGAFAAMEHGILVSCSAGNSGPQSGTATNIAPWMTTVGAGTLDRDFPSYVSLGSGQNYSGESLYSGKALPDKRVPIIYAANASKIGFESEFGSCTPGSLLKKKVTGKIVVCERGYSSRTEKGAAVKDAGGVGMVLANSRQDGEDIMADPHVLPATAVGFAAGEAIKKYIFSNQNPTATLVFEGTKLGVQPSPVVASFSSRGPNKISPQILKPDFIAPGVNILAAYSMNASPTDMEKDTRRVEFNIISGTSMSCPHVSGLAALIKSIHPDWSPAVIRSALMTTAYTNYSSGKTLFDGDSKKPATPFDFGAGHVDPDSALNPGLVYDLTVDDYLHFLCASNYSDEEMELVTRKKYKCDPKKHYSVTDFNYPSFSVVFNIDEAEGESGEKNLTVKHTRTLTNVGDEGTYKVSVKSDTPSVKITVEPEELSFKKNEKKSYAVTFKASGSDSDLESLRGFGSLEWSNGKSVVKSIIAFTSTSGE